MEIRKLLKRTMRVVLNLGYGLSGTADEGLPSLFGFESNLSYFSLFEFLVVIEESGLLPSELRVRFSLLLDSYKFTACLLLFWSFHSIPFRYIVLHLAYPFTLQSLCDSLQPFSSFGDPVAKGSHVF